MRVAIDELQLHDLQNIEAIREIQYTKRCESALTRYLQWMYRRTPDQLRQMKRRFQIGPLGEKRGEAPFLTAMRLSVVSVGGFGRWVVFVKEMGGWEWCTVKARFSRSLRSIAAQQRATVRDS